MFICMMMMMMFNVDDDDHNEVMKAFYVVYVYMKQPTQISC